MQKISHGALRAEVDARSHEERLVLAKRGGNCALAVAGRR
jgi:hypothetical protein